MNILQESLTELEGAILSEIHHRAARTAFKVRMAFQDSRSLEWRGSAGAVYPAIRRLTERGLIMSEPTGSGRRTSLLSLTALGITRLENWICDLPRASSVGLDPFRLRAGMWSQLTRARREEALPRLRQIIEDEIKSMETYMQTLDAVERPRIELAIELNLTRLRWIDKHESTVP